MEVVEHVADMKLFVARCAEMVQPGGLMIAATINRTLKSFALAIVGAEYVLRWLPRGTHQWDKFVTPDELEIAMERAGLRTTDERGVIYNLLADRWELSTDTDVNYMVLAEKARDLLSLARGERAGKATASEELHPWRLRLTRRRPRGHAASALTACAAFDRATRRSRMIDTSWLWVVFTLLAAAGQTARNAMQRELTATLGTVGATHVRFLFGFPFALLSLLGVALITGVALPRPNLSYWPWLLVGALAQIAATALMLAAMGERSFVVVVAYIKTEPIQVAIFGLIFLGDAVSLPMMIAIVIATAGVLVMSYKPGGMTGGIKPDPRSV